MKLVDVDTPSLVVDLNVMENNIRDMAEAVERAGVNLRPMIKTHKSPAIAHKQMKAPATPGIQAAKVAEAEVFGGTGIPDIFVSNEIVGEPKVEKLVNLARNVKVSTSVDSVEGAKGLDDVAKRKKVKIDVLIHVDSGNRRTGTLPGKPTLDLARKIVKFNNLNLTGIWTHEGHNYAGRTPAEVLKITMKAGKDMVDTKKLLERELGIEIYNSVGSTPGAKPLAKMDGVDEVRPGAYIFYDMSQVQMAACKISDCALTVLSTVFSLPAEDRIVCDTGSKTYYPPGEWLAFTNEGGGTNWPLPTVAGGVIKDLNGHVFDDIVFHRWGEEYGILKTYGKKKDKGISIGDKIQVIPYHCCSTVNLHDELVGIRDGEVEAVWPVLARGKSK